MRGVFGNLPINQSGQILVNLGLIYRKNEWRAYWQPWCDWMSAQGWRQFGWYVWDQGSGLPGNWNGRYAPSHEWIFHFNQKAIKPTKGIAKTPDSVKRFRPGECKSRPLRKKDGTTVPMGNPEACSQLTKIPDSVIRIGRRAGSDGHPAQFPVALASYVLASWPGDVYDPFLGSGTTTIAADNLGRRSFGIELEPKYVALALERLSKLDCKCQLAKGHRQ
jgi:DNA modification methylase